MSSSLKNLLKTTPLDHKNFPATNQAHHCWQLYNEYVLCVKRSEGDEESCKPAKQLALSICPGAWVKDWEEQRTNGTFLGVQEKKEEDSKDLAAHH